MSDLDIMLHNLGGRTIAKAEIDGNMFVLHLDDGSLLVVGIKGYPMHWEKA